MTNDIITDEDNIEEINNEEVVDEVVEDEAEEVEESIDEVEEEVEEVKEDISEKLEKKIAIQNRILKRAGFKMVDGKWVKSAEKAEVKSDDSDSLSTKDLYAMMDAKVKNDDVEDVADYAKFKNISIPEALKSTTLKAILENKNEKRMSSDATNTKGGKRGTAKVSDETVLDNAAQGKLPDDPAQLVKARHFKKNKNRRLS